MFRLLQIEFLKLKPYLPFWILAGLFAIITIGGGLAVQSFINQAGDNAAQVSGAVLGQMKLFDFNDLWQNLTWSGRFFFPFLAFLVVLSTHNELNYLTLRQHIIDGISHKEWLVSKVLLILVIAVFAGVVQILAGYIMGYSASPIDSFGDTLKGIVYVPVYMTQVVTFLSLALLITLLIKRSILSFILLLALYFPLEPMIRSIFPDSMNMITDLFPIKAITNVIHSPFAEYLSETDPGGISIREVSILLVQTISYWILSYFILIKRDLQHLLMKKVRYLFTQLILGSIFISNTSFIKEQTEKTLIYIGDPMCSWCYGFAPEISEIQEKLPEDIGFELVVGGLRPYGTETMKELKGFLTHHWEDVSQRSGQPFRYDILDQSELLYDTEPACRAVVTMQTLKPEVDLDYFKTIQKGFYYHNFDPSQTSTYSTHAAEFGIDAQKFTLLFESEEMKRKTKMQFGRARQIGANSFPTVVLGINGKHRVVTKGYTKASEVLKSLERYQEYPGF